MHFKKINVIRRPKYLTGATAGGRLIPAILKGDFNKGLGPLSPLENSGGVIVSFF